MNSRERLKMVLEFKEPDRVPICDTVWEATINRWHKEGLPEDQTPEDFFGYEMTGFYPDTSPQLPIEIIFEDEEYVTYRDSFGGIRRDHQDKSTTPEVIDYPVKTKDDWLRLKEKLVPDRERISFDIYSSTTDHFLPLLTGPHESIEDLLERCRREREEGKFVTYAAAVGYDKMQIYVRTEQLLMLIITDPDWVIDMYRTDAQLAIDMYDIMVEEGFEFDGAFLYCDLGYRNATLFSPKHYREQLHPVFKMLCDYFKSKGLPIILHSCGNVNEVVPDLIEAGFTCLQPLEVKAKMDLIDLKEKYGDQLAFMGGIDVRNMAKDDPTDLEEEIRTKFEVAKKGGGYIYHSDHSVPKNVSFENYRRVIELVRKYGEY